MSNNQNEIKDLAIRLDAIIKTAIDGIITIDEHGKVETINRAAAELFGYTEDEICGNNISMLMPEPHRSKHDYYIENYKATKVAKIIGIGREVEGLKRDGTVFPFRLAVSEVILNDRVIFTGVIHDLSDIKNAEKRLKQINENLETQVDERTTELEEVVNELLKSNRMLERSEQELKELLERERQLNELKTRFVSMASHEFRTPLSTIMSSASLISRYTETEQFDKRERHVHRIKSAVDNLTGILNDFLSLSKLEEGKVDLSPDAINLEELCDDVSLDLRGILKENQKIEASYVGPPRQIITDVRVLKNILFNLMSNAIKYSGPGSTIHCRHRFSEENIDFEITDEGLGIPETEQQYLFDRFFRASNVENIQGTGLGLNIVKRYIELLKGSITFKSEEGIGTTFIVTLPYEI